MKKRIYFIISAILQIVASVWAIVNADKLIESLIQAFGMYPEGFGDRVVDLFQNSGNTYIIVISIICILVNSFIIYFAYQNKLLKNKGKVIACSIISFLTSTYSVIELLAIINIIIMAISKRVNPEDFPDKKEELPVLDREEINKNNIIKAIILLGIYFSQFIWADFIPRDGNIKIVISLVFYLVMIVLSIVFFNNLYKRDFLIFRKNFKAYFQNLVPMIGKYYLIYLVVAMIAVLLANEATSVNQTNIEALPIWYSLPLAVIYAPIVEETLFRGCIRRFIKNDKLFIVISAIVFGLLHTAFTEETIYNTFVLAIPYVAMGGFLAYIHVKTNNMFSNMSFHAFHNTIAMIISILIKGIFII